MGSRSEESSAGDPQSPSVFGGSSNRNTSSFQCNICLDPAREPVVTLCGHLFCWPCLYEWLHGHSSSSECPVCKATVEEEDIVPLYSGGNGSTDPRSRSIDGPDIPSRPAACRRSARAQQPQPDMNSFHHHNIQNPWSMGWNQVAAVRHGDFSFPEAAAGGVAASLHHGWHTNVFHCWNGHGQLSHRFYHGHGHHAPGFWRHTNHRQQVNVICNMLFLLFVALVVANTISRIFM
ncbi:hypothetical protein GW17_00020518 [Ensete ventricosum]|nr:hypothetical protein GW17_00020518 [Ensete ventricosum]RZS20325.1 hypothetical protein BHM03_00052833 [Ensete ventricosum]